jgi:hypothetical protein
LTSRTGLLARLTQVYQGHRMNPTAMNQAKTRQRVTGPTALESYESPLQISQAAQYKPNLINTLRRQLGLWCLPPRLFTVSDGGGRWPLRRPPELRSSSAPVFRRTHKCSPKAPATHFERKNN